MTTATMLLDARNIVGESLVWDERSGRLVWVDIVGRTIHTLELGTGQHNFWPTPDFVTCLGLRADGGAIVGFTKDIVLWDFVGAFRPFATLESNEPSTRLNEGVVGPDGAFWVGTMQNNIAPDGSPKEVTDTVGRLYRITSDGAVQSLSEDRFAITNTFAFLDDGSLVTADTLENTLYRYPINGGTLGPRVPFFADFERGLPDGSCVDGPGYVWNCRVAGGACLVRLASDGTLERAVDVPPSWPTSCAFGGPDLDRLFVTSARFTMDDAHLAAFPHEGGVFELSPGVRGRATHRFDA